MPRLDDIVKLLGQETSIHIDPVFGTLLGQSTGNAFNPDATSNKSNKKKNACATVTSCTQPTGLFLHLFAQLAVRITF